MKVGTSTNEICVCAFSMTTTQCEDRNYKMKEKQSWERDGFPFLSLFLYTLLSDFDITITTPPLFKPFVPSFTSLFLPINNDNYFKQFSLYIQRLFTVIASTECLLEERRKRQKQTGEKKQKTSEKKRANVTPRLLFLLFMNKKKCLKENSARIQY